MLKSTKNKALQLRRETLAKSAAALECPTKAEGEGKAIIFARSASDETGQKTGQRDVFFATVCLFPT